MSLTITIETSNAAFADGQSDEEVEQIIRHVADLIAGGYLWGPVHDSNGNTCGSWAYERPVNDKDGDE